MKGEKDYRLFQEKPVKTSKKLKINGEKFVFTTKDLRARIERNGLKISEPTGRFGHLCLLLNQEVGDALLPDSFGSGARFLTSEN